LSEVCSDQAASTHVFFHGNDSTDSDFIQEHIESFFPPADPQEEVIEEDLEENIGEEEGDEGIPDDVPDEIQDVIKHLEFSDMEEEEDASGAVVSVISGEVGQDDAEKILDMLLNREYDEDDEFEDRSANYHVLEKPMTTGIHLDVIHLIPRTGFEMGELGDEPGDWTDVFDEWFDYITDLLDDIADLFVSGFAYVAEFLTNLDEILKDWGMRVIDAIGEAFSAVRDAVSEVVEFIRSLIQHLVDKFYTNMYDLTLRLEKSNTEVQNDFVGMGVDAMSIAIGLAPIVLIVNPETLQEVALDAWKDALNLTDTTTRMVISITGTVMSLITMATFIQMGRADAAIAVGLVTLAWLLFDLYILIQEDV